MYDLFWNVATEGTYGTKQASQESCAKEGVPKELMLCTIRKEDGEILCKDIEVSLVSSDGFGWFGDFDLPKDCWLEPDNYILRLENGKEGPIRILPFEPDILSDTTTHRRLQVQGNWL